MGGVTPPLIARTDRKIMRSAGMPSGSRTGPTAPGSLIGLHCSRLIRKRPPESTAAVNSVSTGWP